MICPLLFRLQILLHPGLDTILHLLAFEQERQLLERAVAGLGEDEVDGDALDDEPHAVPDVVPPADGVHADGVDEGVDEGRQSAPDLLHGDTLGADGVGEEFDEVGCAMLVGENRGMRGTYCM